MGASLLALAKVSYAKAGDLTAGFFFSNQIIIICNHNTAGK